MLLRFAVSNHLSIKDTQELSFIKSALKGPEDGLLSTPALPKDKVLPAAIIYGPNASGKTNMVDALRFMRDAVHNSHRSWAPDAGVPRKPFLLCKDCLESPSRFELDFEIDGVRHTYGFACNSSQFTEEWLYAAPVGHNRMIFERTGPEASDLKFGASFTGQKQAISQLMRSNSLFLSAAFQNNHPLAKSVVSTLRRIRVLSNLTMEPLMLAMLLKDKDLDARIVSFLSEMGTGITKHRQVERQLSDEQTKLSRAFLEAMWDHGQARPSEDDRKSALDRLNREFKVEFAHQSEDGHDVFFDAARESAGTRRLIDLLRGVMLALDEGFVCVIDEIDSSLHTQVCEAIIALFTNRETNQNGAQIIATTHDTNLFNAPNLRRDELWLVEKSPGGASEFYSLADVKTRETDNFERGYLQGRYGAVPFSGSAVNLVRSL